VSSGAAAQPGRRAANGAPRATPGHRDTVGNHHTVSNHHTAISFLLAAVSGLAQVLLFPQFSLWFLAPLAVAPLLVAVARETGTRRHFLLGWLAGAIYWAGSCYWIYDVMHRYAYMAAAAAAAIFAGFFLVKGLHLGVFAMIARRCRGGAGRYRR